MNRAVIVTLTALLLVGCSNGGPSDALISEPAVSPTAVGVEAPTIVDEVAADLAAPWSVVPLADGRALISERDSARILLLRDGRTTVIANPAQFSPMARAACWVWPCAPPTPNASTSTTRRRPTTGSSYLTSTARP